MLERVTGIARRVIGTRNDRELKRMQPIVHRINELESTYKPMKDEELRARVVEMRERVANGAALDDLLPDTFAIVREAAVRALGERPFDVQLLGGIVLHRGRIAEMKTGEGKTLVATMPVTLNALTGRGVHIVTVNDYLASRDAEWMGRIYNLLGLSVGRILSSERDDEVKRAAYACDVTYGTNNEFGFDYLRDNMKYRVEDMVQRGFHFGIVDEVDSILIDEARTPLIISGPTRDPVDLYLLIDGVVPLLQNELDYTVDEKHKNVTLTDQGVDKIERRLGIDNLYDPHNMEVLHKVDQALKAHMLFKRDRDYVVREGQVVIVDEHTGRLMVGRRWSDGLHQAIEAKERVQIEAESQTYATITFQNFFRMYEKLAGMTGTAETEAEEFYKIYKLEVSVIPTNVRVNRTDNDDVVYKTQMEKFRRVIEDIEDCRTRGQPVLVGTVSVEKSEIVAQMLEKRGIRHEVLNAKNHAREAMIIAQAGRKSAVTISTNMAGRGTDIKLGGDPTGLAKDEVDPVQDPEGYAAALARFRETCKKEREEVIAAGGLHIIGTERHESRRIDNQLRGRSGRQGDPGSSRFYLSLEDDLLRIFGSDKIVVWMERMGLKDDEPIEHRWITKSIENAQKKVEGYHFNVRKNLLEYDDVLNAQRKAVYELRRKALVGENVREMIQDSLTNLVDDVMDESMAEGVHPEDWNVVGMKERLAQNLGYQWEASDDAIRDMAVADIRNHLNEVARSTYEAREAEVGEERMRRAERFFLSQHTDQLWKDHLLAMDRLRDGIGLRGYGQRNPLLEYKKEGFNMFHTMAALRDEAVVRSLLQFQPSPELDAAFEMSSRSQVRRAARQALPQARGAAVPVGGLLDAPVVDAADLARQISALRHAPIADNDDASPVPERPAPGLEARAFAKAHDVRRNDPCPCGSGKKYKKCCGMGEA
ncbi:MAG: preprotein translocase subunit SecA [Deltaproteobacteria bacterium]|nr:preprotein translocase subunit SecA [Deltaproteobacteria bacterium]